MPDDPIIRSPRDPEDCVSSDDDKSLEELRHLILAPEQERLAQLRARVENRESRTSDLSAVLPEAIRLRREQGGEDALGEALRPTVESALRESVRKDPQTMADALFPVMGPAIRRSIFQTLRSLFESFNQTMEQSLSMRGLKWRLEALRTGRPFSEVVLLHSLVFRVEQVFLIHKKTGLPLNHVVAPAVAMQDASLVSGMLSAIQDFVRDSFNTPKGQLLEKINVGEVEVWVEDGPYAILASVIRGMPPPAYRSNMVETLERIHRRFAPEMEKFQGETAPFVGTTDDLTRCLEFQYKDKGIGRPKSYVLAFGAIAALAIIGGLSVLLWRNHKWGVFVETLRQQPGIVVTSFERHGWHYTIQGLRDPLSADPQALLQTAGLERDQADFHWGAYYALDDPIVEQRATRLLKPPSGVKLSVSDGVLRPEGQAPTEWINGLQQQALVVPGIRGVDFSRLIDSNQAEFNRLVSVLQAAIIKFPVSSASLSQQDLMMLKELAADIRLLLEKAQALHKNIALDIVGHSDSTGPEATNRPLSQGRADRVLSQFVSEGLPRKLLQSRGVATQEPLQQEDSEASRQYNRSVTFRISSLAPGR